MSNGEPRGEEVKDEDRRGGDRGMREEGGGGHTLHISQLDMFI